MITRKTSVVYIISDIDKSLGFEWAASELKKSTVLNFILIGNEGTTFERYLAAANITYVTISDSKYPGNLSKFIRVVRVLLRIRPNVVHCHMWRANLIGLTAAWLVRIPQRIYTRHHAMIHYREFPKGRKWDLLCNQLATKIIAISENVKRVLTELDGARPSKVTIIHHGFDINYFLNVDESRPKALKEKYQLNDSSPIIGVVSRYLELKGIQFTIDAFLEIKEEFPKAHLLLSNAKGYFETDIKKLLARLPTGSFTEILFEADLAALYRIMDVHIHVPIDSMSEAFGQTYVESLICGVPGVFTLSGVAPEFIVDGVNALVVPYKNANAIAVAVKRILREPEVKGRLIANGKQVVNLFSLDKMINALLALYEK